MRRSANNDTEVKVTIGIKGYRRPSKAMPGAQLGRGRSVSPIAPRRIGRQTILGLAVAAGLAMLMRRDCRVHAGLGP